MDKIVCVGKNYIEHAKELGDAVPAKPVLFLKPPSILRQGYQGKSLDLFLPVDRGSVHHECEIVIQLKNGGFRMSEAEASKAIGAVSVGLDMTLRDQQMALKKAGSPWTVSKVFTDSAVVGPWVPVEKFSDWAVTSFSLRVNGNPRQEGVASQMTLSPSQCLAYISEHFPLCPGDLIFTGTPKGVGPVEPGDAAVLKFGSIEFSVLWHALKL
jgi:2-keto-4-pentenoate hydratase/2-oxohepta-3-ene-1,7-dioic acid hydratase in catechol pathway